MPSAPDREDRLAAAARALAAAEGRSSAPSSRPGTPSAERRAQPAPPPDPEAEGAELEPHEVARTIVLRQLTGSPKSRSQLEDVLRRRNCPEDVAAAVLDRMEEVGLVDDTAFAQTFVHSKQRNRGLARRAFVHELRRKGVADEVADAVLDDIDPAAERERARQLVDKKLRTLHGLDASVQTRRLAGMLARKGYPSDLALTVIREALSEAPEHQRD